MKSKLLILLISLTFGCSAPKLIKENKHPETGMNIKKLNIESLEESENKITKNYEVKIKRRLVIEDYTNEKNNYIEYRKINFKTKDIIEINRILPELYMCTKTNPDNEIKKLYLFYIDGSLKTTGEIFTGKPVKGILTPYEFKTGIWKTYDIYGVLQDSINYDIYFSFTFDDILKFIKDNHLKLIPKPYLSYHNPNDTFKLISRDIINNKGVWKLRLVTDNENYDHKWITIDGDTGKVLESGYVKENLY